jgi:hypothetical protein
MSGRFYYRTGVFLVLMVALLGFQACSNDDDPVAPRDPAADAPALPDLSTMTMDLSFFGLAGVDESSMELGKPSQQLLAASTGKDNFINAAVRVLFVQLTFCAVFEPPVAAFALAIHSIPQKQDDGSYLWTYIFVDEAIEHSIFLYGKDEGDYVAWRMEVSTNNPGMMLDHFVWFDGEAMKDDTHGYWQFYEPVAEPAFYVDAVAAGTPGVESVRIDWLNAPGNVHRLTLLNNMEGHVDEGDNVVFMSSPAMSSIELTDVSVPETYSIVWYYNGSGFLQVPDFPEADPGVKSCWDTQQFDVICPD